MGLRGWGSNETCGQSKAELTARERRETYIRQ